MDMPRRIIEKALDCGVNFFDTANGYHGGAAETILGTVLAEHPRGSYAIATKVYSARGEWPTQRGLSRKHIFDEVHKSLKRLNTDYIDLYYCHWYDSETPISETLCAMSDLIKQGLILYYGVSNWTAAQIAYGLREIERYGLYSIAANQPTYNMLNRYIEAESIPLCAREGIGQVVYSPLAQGVLTGKYKLGGEYPKDSRAVNPRAGGGISVFDYLSDETLETVEKLRILADEAGITLTEMALAWTLREPNVSSALVGASVPEQIKLNAAAVEKKLSPDLLERIEDTLASSKHMPKHHIIPW
jgi:aryl-alcohol dehydrogenase-like predicted oxidoreductase